jgi:cytochrome c-type biogenesis protein CcmE
MRKVLTSLLVVLFVAVGLAAQEKAAGEKKKELRWHGTIIRSDKDASTLTVRQRGGTVERIVHYTSDTKWTKLNKPAEPSEFKDGARVICLGNFDEQKKFVATRIDLREPAR